MPDHQELWLAPAAGGASVLVELLEAQAGVPDADLAAHLLHDAAEATEARSVRAAPGGARPVAAARCPAVLRVAGASAWRLDARMAVPPRGGSGDDGDGGGDGGGDDDVALALGVVRLPAPADSELLVTVHAPIPRRVGGGGAGGRDAGEGGADAAAAAASLELAGAVCDRVLATLRLEDLGLFG